MKSPITSLVLLAPFLWACGATFPPPTQRMADAKAAERSAEELGANDVPDAKLSLKLAQEQIAAAEKSMVDGENRRADSLLVRAKADAELSIAQAREKKARTETEGAIADSAAQKATNAGQGAVK
ncbi:MAG: DUF4398 domain-containing protein [Myxococcales bacterium]|nr:DUF4398 domain-containing protein [Myxococcales bacterium]